MGLAGGAEAQLPSTNGWFTVPSTSLAALCPGGVPGGIGCSAVTAAWGSAVMDTKRNRLIVWGGGHADYFGNEIYAINLTTPQGSVRLTNPSTPFADDACPESLATPLGPNSRHTYDQLAYLPNTDELFVWGGSVSCSTSRRSSVTWAFSFATGTWTQLASFPDGIGAEATAIAYDEVTGDIYGGNNLTGNWWRYVRATNTMVTLPNSFSSGVTNIAVATIDPKRRRLWYIGGGQVWRYDISNAPANPSSFVPTNPALTGCGNIVNHNAGGMLYVAALDRIVGWNGGDVITLLDLDTLTCTTQTWAGGPSRVVDGFDNGVYDRWNYSPIDHVFVYYGSMSANVSVLRIQPQADADFGVRCFAAGVTQCHNADSTVGMALEGSGALPTIDTVVRTSGTGSVRIRQPIGCTGAECGGAAVIPFNMDCGPGTTCFWQHRFRINSAMLTNVSSGPWTLWKWSITHGANTGSCSGIEITGETYPGVAGLFRMYSNCGGTTFTTQNQDPAFIYNAIGDTVQQSAQTTSGYNCQYPAFPAGTGNGVGCFRFAADTWYTIDYQLIFGSYNVANSTFRMWMTAQGDTTRRQVLELRNVSLNFQNGSADPGYNVMRWIVYQTGGFGGTPAQADAWYDEMIVSTQAIALPGATPALATRTLTAVRGGLGVGTLTSVPSGIACGVTCTAVFTLGALITLTAAANQDSVFSAWSGGCSGISTCDITLDNDTTVTATFDLQPVRRRHVRWRRR